MNTELIIVTEYCRICNIEPSFIFQLGEDGLIDIQVIEQEPYLHISQLSDIEIFTRLHYELSINVAGIDAIQNLLKQIEEMRKEIEALRNQLSLGTSNENKNMEEI